MDLEQRRRVRGAVYRGDGEAIVAALTLPDVLEDPQIAGAALLVAVAQQIPGATPLAARCVAALTARDSSGDPELAAELNAALSSDSQANTAFASIPVDLEQVDATAPRGSAAV